MLIGYCTVATQTCYEEPDRSFDSKKTTSDPQCSECKINYRDPGTKDLIMYLHAWKYKVSFKLYIFKDLISN